MKAQYIEAANQTRNEWAVSDGNRDNGVVPADVKELLDISYCDSETEDEKEWHLCDIYYPKNQEMEKYPVIVSIHGGGWFYGDKKLYSLYTKCLAEKGFAVVNFNYRRCPEYQYPSTFVDVCALMSYIAEHAEKYHLDMDRLYVVGDSAGAQLCSQYGVFATSEAYRKLLPETEGFTVPVPKKLGLNCGVYTFKPERDTRAMTWYLPDEPSEDLLKSFLNIMDYMNEDFPSPFVMTSVNDPLLPRSKDIMERMDEVGVKYIYKEYGQNDKKDGHVFHCNMRSKDGIQCNNDEVAFFNEI